MVSVIHLDRGLVRELLGGWLRAGFCGMDGGAEEQCLLRIALCFPSATRRMADFPSILRRSRAILDNRAAREWWQQAQETLRFACCLEGRRDDKRFLGLRQGSARQGSSLLPLRNAPDAPAPLQGIAPAGRESQQQAAALGLDREVSPSKSHLDPWKDDR